MALAAYPFIVYLSLSQAGPRWLALVLGLLFVLRWWVGGKFAHGTRGHRTTRMLAVAVALGVALVMALNDPLILKFYPVLANLAVLGLFAASLFQPPTIIERGLRLAGQPVPPEAPPYLWWVTLVWCGFFIVNAAIAAWTAIAAPLSWWALYNGGISYALIGTLLVGELIVRQFYKRAIARRQALDDREP
ncbi:MAG: hypothetical protein AAGF46_01620 [Pseudomonadota bacterium]